MLKLGVNIDHVATLREARYRGQRGQSRREPSPVDAAIAAEAAGAHGITAHLREDRRHILDSDIAALRKAVNVRFNFELANTAEMVRIALYTKPETVCLVPEKREEITTEGGLDVAGQLPALKRTCKKMAKAGIEVSLFINPDAKQVDASARSGAQFIELHTGQFGEHFGNARTRQRELNRLIAAAEHAHEHVLQRRPPRRPELRAGHQQLQPQRPVGRVHGRALPAAEHLDDRAGVVYNSP